MSQQQRFIDDTLLITTMAVLAACGLIYEYLLSHFSGRVLGIMESTIYTMIGLMIVAMGLGAFAARGIQKIYQGFIVLELIIALLGCSAIFIIATSIGISQLLPQVLADTFELPPDIRLNGGLFKTLSQISFTSPYFFGAILGFFIGMEIPIIARIREHRYQQHLTHNLGTIYGADYIGAGIGAALWVLVLLNIEIAKAAAITASLNLLAGLFFLWRFWSELAWRKTILACKAMLLLLIAITYLQGNQWLNNMSNLLYLDQVVYNGKTRYQQLTFTERNMGLNNPSVINFYLNGRLQFSSSDEVIYHNYLVQPVLAGSARQDNILIIGGGDGLALRDVLAWQPKHVTLIDLDAELVDFFKQPEQHFTSRLANKIKQLNQSSLADNRVTIVNNDAFIAIDSLLQQQQSFDAIIVDLPDPSHPDLNKLYSVSFYAKLRQLLAGDGLIGIQSTSPYHAKNAFISIKKTVIAAEFTQVEQYHDNVPSFGEWGWTIAAKMGAPASERLNQLTQLPKHSQWLTLAMLKGAFAFPENFYQNQDHVPVNYLGSHVLYQLHQQAWKDQQGLNNSSLQN